MTNFLTILAAGIANIILGMIWYHPKVFGGSWMRMLNSSPEMIERGKRDMWKNTIFALIAGMLAAYVLEYFGNAYGVVDWLGALQLGFWAWLGFTAVPMLGMILWEQRSVRYYAIVSGYWLVSFIVMSFILLF